MSIYLKDSVREISAQTWIQFPRWCPLFLALLQTHTEVCFLTNVGPTMVILLSWLFGAFSPRQEVIMTWNIGTHRKPSSDQLSHQSSPACTPPHELLWDIETTYTTASSSLIFFHASEIAECQDSIWPNIILKPECPRTHSWRASACYFQRPMLFWAISSLVWLDSNLMTWMFE